MAVSARVRMDDDYDDAEGDKKIKQVGNRWRVYEGHDYYSQTSGGVSLLGPVMRDLSYRIISFATIEEAREWIRGGCRVVDESGTEIF